VRTFYTSSQVQRSHAYLCIFYLSGCVASLQHKAVLDTFHWLDRTSHTPSSLPSYLHHRRSFLSPLVYIAIGPLRFVTFLVFLLALDVRILHGYHHRHFSRSHLPCPVPFSLQILFFSHLFITQSSASNICTLCPCLPIIISASQQYPAAQPTPRLQHPSSTTNQLPTINTTPTTLLRIACALRA
jgi:hypothetical protein